MKNLMIVLVLTFICYLSSAQVTDEMTNLKKQVNALKSRNAKIELRLKEYKDAAKNANESLQMQLKENAIKINALSDSLVIKETNHAAMQTKIHSLHHSMRICNTILYIILIIVVLALIGIYLLTIRKVETLNEKNDVKLTNSKEALENELDKSKKDLLAQISSIKEEITKLKDQKK